MLYYVEVAHECGATELVMDEVYKVVLLCIGQAEAARAREVHPGREGAQWTPSGVSRHIRDA